MKIHRIGGPDQEPVPLYAKASGKDQDTILPGATAAANKIFTWSVSVPFAEKNKVLSRNNGGVITFAYP